MYENGKLQRVLVFVQIEQITPDNLLRKPSPTFHNLSRERKLQNSRKKHLIDFKTALASYGHLLTKQRHSQTESDTLDSEEPWETDTFRNVLSIVNHMYSYLILSYRENNEYRHPLCLTSLATVRHLTGACVSACHEDYEKCLSLIHEACWKGREGNHLTI